MICTTSTYIHCIVVTYTYVTPGWVIKCVHWQVLTKSYVVECKVDEDDPFSFEGPSIVKTAG